MTTKPKSIAVPAIAALSILGLITVFFGPFATSVIILKDVFRILLDGLVSLTQSCGLSQTGLDDGELWRTFTYILVPDTQNPILTLIVIWLWVDIGRTIERVVGWRWTLLIVFSTAFLASGALSTLVTQIHETALLSIFLALSLLTALTFLGARRRSAFFTRLYRWRWLFLGIIAYLALVPIYDDHYYSRGLWGPPQTGPIAALFGFIGVLHGLLLRNQRFRLGAVQFDLSASVTFFLAIYLFLLIPDASNGVLGANMNIQGHLLAWLFGMHLGVASIPQADLARLEDETLAREPFWVMLFRVWTPFPARRIAFIGMIASLFVGCIMISPIKFNMKRAGAGQKTGCGQIDQSQLTTLIRPRLTWAWGGESIHACTPTGTLRFNQIPAVGPNASKPRTDGHPKTMTVLDMLAIGYPHFISDLIFIQARRFFIQQLFDDRILGESFDQYVDAITALDPLNAEAYLWASRRVKYEPLITRSTILRANDYSKRGLRRYPNDWRFYMEIGFNLYFEYPNVALDAVDEERARTNAIENFEIAASLPGAIIDPNFITDLHMRENNTDMALMYAYELYFDASPDEREQLKRRVAMIEQKAAEKLEKLTSNWEGHFSYIPLRLASMLGEPIQQGTRSTP